MSSLASQPLRPHLAAVLLLLAPAVAWAAAAPSEPHHVNVVAGVVQPTRPMRAAIDDAIHFLRKADGEYVPGNINGDLAGYFTSALVQPDGTRSKRMLAFPARHHAYFIRTFLAYHAYTHQPEWVTRARDLADWNLAHSTPADCPLPNLPYSSYENGKPTGSQDKNSTEPDKAAFIGTYYLALNEVTGEARYLDGARKIATTIIKWQRPDGSVPFRIVPTDGSIFQDFGGAPVYYVEFFERLLRHDDKPEYRQAHAKALQCMLSRAAAGEWGTYHEDVKPQDKHYLSAEPMSFTADYLFRSAQGHPQYVELGRKILQQMEASLVFTAGHAAAPAPAVAEQANYAHIMPGHTARYCLALADLYAATADLSVRVRALSGFNAVTYMQSPAGLFVTYFYDTKKKHDGAVGKPDWYSQHLYTVCHLLEAAPLFPEFGLQAR